MFSMKHLLDNQKYQAGFRLLSHQYLTNGSDVGTDDLAVSHTNVYCNEFVANILHDICNIGMIIFDLLGCTIG